MAVVQKTYAQVVSEWENGTIEWCAWAAKMPGADKVVAFIRNANGTRVVYEVGP